MKNRIYASKLCCHDKQLFFSAPKVREGLGSAVKKLTPKRAGKGEA